MKHFVRCFLILICSCLFVQADAGFQARFNPLNDDLVISPLRPRLFVRADDARIGRGLTLSALRSRLHDEAYQDWVHYRDDEGISWGSLPAIAMQYLLKGDEEKALAVGQYIANTPFSFKEHTSAAAMVYNSAIAFDWVRNALSDEMAGKISARLVEGAEHLKGGVTSPAINHNYSIVSLEGVAMVAIAIYGEGNENNEKAFEYLKMIDDLFLKDQMLFDTFKAKNGTWAEGNHYTPFVVFHPFLMTIRGLTTATSTDYFRIIREDYDNFIEPMSRFLIANFRPDFTLERIGDVTARVVPHKTFLRPVLDLLASEIRNRELQGQVHSFAKKLSLHYGPDLVHDLYGWMQLVTYDAKLPDNPSYKTLPLAMRFGEGTYEHIMFRSNWDSDATMITYISGDHYTDHQHFDKGHFLIYKKGGLTVDGGGYSGMYKTSWANYSVRTLAHNNVLVHDPEEPARKGIGNTVLYPDGGQRVIRRSQSVQSWKEYKEKSEELGLNTADVLAFSWDERSNEYNYVKSDLTKAYGDNVTWMDRQLLYLPQADYLLVKDRVLTERPLDKYWLLHFQEPPIIDGNAPAPGIKSYSDVSVVQSKRTGELALEGQTVRYSGSMFVKTLLPEKNTISVIGGPGYEYYNRFSKMNFPPERPFSSNRESGNWRMEVSAKKPASATAFLHAFEIGHGDMKSMVSAQYVKSRDRKMEGAFFESPQNPYVVLFSSSLDSRGHAFQQVSFPLRYRIRSSAATTHVLAELTPGKHVQVYANDENIGTFQTSKAGVLSFKDRGTGVRKIKIQAK